MGRVFRHMFFRAPSHAHQMVGLGVSGLCFIMIGFLFRGPAAHMVQIIFTASGLSQLLVGGAEFLPRHQTTLAALLRIGAFGCAVSGIVLLLALARGPHP